MKHWILWAKIADVDTDLGFLEEKSGVIGKSYPSEGVTCVRDLEQTECMADVSQAEEQHLHKPRTEEIGVLPRKRRLSVVDCRIGTWRMMRETEAKSSSS